MKADFVGKNLVWMKANFIIICMITTHTECVKIFPHEIKATRREDLLHGK